MAFTDQALKRDEGREKRFVLWRYRECLTGLGRYQTRRLATEVYFLVPNILHNLAPDTFCQRLFLIPPVAPYI